MGIAPWKKADESSIASGVSDTVANYFQSDARRRLGVIDACDRSWDMNQQVDFGVTVFFPTAPRVGR